MIQNSFVSALFQQSLKFSTQLHIHVANIKMHGTNNFKNIFSVNTNRERSTNFCSRFVDIMTAKRAEGKIFCAFFGFKRLRVRSPSRVKKARPFFAGRWLEKQLLEVLSTLSFQKTTSLKEKDNMATSQFKLFNFQNTSFRIALLLWFLNSVALILQE